MAGGPIESGAIDKFRRGWRFRCLGRLPAGTAMALDHGHDSLFDHDQRCDHLADALAGQILEIAGFVNPDNVVLHILRQTTVVTVAQGRGESTRAVVDNLCRRRIFWVAVSMLSTAAPSSPAARAMRRSLPSLMSTESSRMLCRIAD